MVKIFSGGRIWIGEISKDGASNDVFLTPAYLSHQGKLIPYKTAHVYCDATIYFSDMPEDEVSFWTESVTKTDAT